jgi:protein phosphatase 1L
LSSLVQGIYFHTWSFFLQDAVSLVNEEEEAEAAARKLTKTAFTRGSADNITCIVVRFHHEKAHPANNPDKANPASSHQEK